MSCQKRKKLGKRRVTKPLTREEVGGGNHLTSTARPYQVMSTISARERTRSEGVTTPISSTTTGAALAVKTKTTTAKSELSQARLSVLRMGRLAVSTI